MYLVILAFDNLNFRQWAVRYKAIRHIFLSLREDPPKNEVTRIPQNFLLPSILMYIVCTKYYHNLHAVKICKNFVHFCFFLFRWPIPTFQPLFPKEWNRQKLQLVIFMFLVESIGINALHYLWSTMQIRVCHSFSFG